MNSKPLLLFFSPVIPLETGNGASMRCGMALEALASRYQITLVVASQSPGLSEAMLPESMRSLCSRVWIRGLVPTDVQGSMAARIRSQPKPLQLVLHAIWPIPLDLCWVPEAWIEELKAWLAHEHFSGVHAFRLSMMQLVAPLVEADVPVVLDFDDVESKAMERLARLQRSGLGRVMYLVKRLEAIKTAWAERRAVRRARRVLVCSEADRIELSRRFEADKLLVMPNGVRIPTQLSSRALDGALRVLFVGSLDYAPNQDAVTSLVGGLAVEIASAVPQGVTWRIVGRHPSAIMMDQVHRAGIALVADAPDMREHYDWADAIIVPIRSGGGTRIKILEALSLGKPVVSSTLGAEGLELEDGKDILVADTGEQYAKAFFRLATDAPLYDGLVASGRETVERLYSQETIAAQLLAAHARSQNRPLETAFDPEQP